MVIGVVGARGGQGKGWSGSGDRGGGGQEVGGSRGW